MRMVRPERADRVGGGGGDLTGLPSIDIGFYVNYIALVTHKTKELTYIVFIILRGSCTLLVVIIGGSQTCPFPATRSGVS